MIVDFSPVIGVHLGPGAIGVVVCLEEIVGPNGDR